MANTLSVAALPDGSRKVTIHSAGERDLSAVLSSDQLDELVRLAHNDQSRGALSAAPEEAREAGADNLPPRRRRSHAD